MQLALLSYLIRDKNGTDYFRRSIPIQLQPVIAGRFKDKANWEQSLKSKDPKQAKCTYKAEMYDALRNRTALTQDDIRSLGNL